MIGAESKAHFSAHTLGIILCVFSSQQQADVVCAVNLCGTCCTNFMCGSVKNKSASSHHEAKSKSVFVTFPNEDMQYFCPSSLGLVILPLFFWCDLFPAAKKYIVAWQPLKEDSALPFLKGTQKATLFSWSVSVSHPHSFWCGK